MNKTYEDILDIAVDNYPGTIRDYLEELLLTLWSEKEGFSGKRPFGNSGWEYDLYIALVREGIVKGSFDEEGDLMTCYQNYADELISDLISYIFSCPIKYDTVTKEAM